jgi:hypothetical protein
VRHPERTAAGVLAVLVACGAWLAATGAAELPLLEAPRPAAHRTAEVSSAEPIRAARTELTEVAEETPASAPVPLADAALMAVVDRIAAGDADYEAVRDVRDLLVAAPELAASLPTMVRQGDDLTVRRLLQALEFAGTAACQDALAQVAGDPRQSLQDRRRALGALGRMPEPAELTMQRLWAFYASGDAELSRAALLAYGRAASAVRCCDAARGVRAETALVCALQGARDREEMVAALQAIGRCGDADLDQAVAPFLTSVDDEVRAAAMRALAGSGG